jgi:S-formylglutathione hydrolase FrmB
VRRTLNVVRAAIAQGCVLALALALPARAGDAPQGTITMYRIAAPSVSDPQRSVRVYLPATYARPEARERRYPVVFLLHGWPGGDGNWPGSGHAGDTLDSLIAGGRIPELIAVMPNGGGIGFLGRSMYINTWDGSSRVEDFVVRDLVAWVDRTFRTKAGPRYRGLIGLSEGGSAAVNLAFKHPDVFGACGSHSGDFRLERGMGEAKILGPDSAAARVIAENSPLDYLARVAPRLRDMSIYFDCGVADGDEIAQGRELHRKLGELGVPHVWNEFPGGHTWGYWRTHLRDSLLAVTAKML